MKFTANQIAKLVKGKVFGDKNIEINNFNISCHNLGCSDSKNKLKLWYTDKNKRGGSSILQDTDKEINKYDKTKLIFELLSHLILYQF